MKIIFLVSIMILVTFTTSFAEILLKADDSGKFNGNLQNVSLLEVKSFFEENYGIKFVGDETLFQTEVTISITKLNLEKTLKRILSRVNIAFNYNSQGKITAVNLLPTSQKQTKPVKANNLVKTNDQQSTLEPAQDPFLENNTDLNDSPKIMAEDPNNQVKDEITNFQVVPNSPPPGDPIKDDPNDGITSFQIKPNSPPPGDSSATGPVLPSGDFSESGPILQPSGN